MQKNVKYGATFLIVIILILLAVVVAFASLQSQQGVNHAQAPERNPAFEGELVTAVLSQPNPNVAYITTVASDAGWTEVVNDDFEAGLDENVWTTSDQDGTTNGEYKWGTEVISNTLTPASVRSAWAIGGGEQGGLLDPTVDGYPPNADSWLILGSIDMSDALDGVINFSYSFEADAGDTFAVLASIDGTNYSGLQTSSGGPGGWSGVSYGLSQYAGESMVQIAFQFTSDDSANLDGKLGALIDDVVLQLQYTEKTHLPYIVYQEPPPTPTATPNPIYYIDDFSNTDSGWLVKDNRNDPQDCWRWYYANNEYNVDICDDRTDVKVSPGVHLPEGDYELEVSSRFRGDVGWWSAYGIMFDAKDDPNPDNSDLGDYNMLWILWEGENQAKWKLLKDLPGEREDITGWSLLGGNKYDYGNDGTNFNHWKIVRTGNQISVYVNGNHLRTVNDQRPTTNNQVLFGLFASTYEMDQMEATFDNFKVIASESNQIIWSIDSYQPSLESGEFELESSLPLSESNE